MNETEQDVALRRKDKSRPAKHFAKRRNRTAAPRRDGCYVVAMLESLLLLLVSQNAAAESPSRPNIVPSRPNIVIVITDDQGYGDLSCHGNPVLKTPQLDKLHAESVRLTDYHVAPTCSPTRAALMTGHWQNATGVWHTIAGRSLLRESEVTLATRLNELGYDTAMFGKWHLGDNYPNRPIDRGFDEVFIHGGGGVGQTPDYWDNAYFGGHYFRGVAGGDLTPEPVEGHCTDVWFDAAEDFIRRQAAEDDGEPFFAYIATNAPHGPFHSRPDYAEHYADYGTKVQHFFGMIEHVDARIGTLRDVLDENGLTENTLFLFTTDNGTASGAKVFNAGMKGGKGTEYEGGHRVPAFWHWPAGGIGGEGDNRDVDLLSAHVDIAPTILDLVGGELPGDGDGLSLSKPLRGQEIDLSPRTVVTDSQRIRYPVRTRKTAVMRDRWRLVNNAELYDIKADPGQRKNVIADHPELVAELRADYDAWWDSLTPGLDEVVHIPVGTDAAEEVLLTAHDWFVDDIATPWNQAAIRDAKLLPAGSIDATDNYWNVEVMRPGRYELRLRRWPSEAAAAIDASLSPGDPVPGSAAFRTTPGESIAPLAATAVVQWSDVRETATFDAGSEVATVTIEMSTVGDTQLRAGFEKENGFVFAPYVVVRRIGDANAAAAATASTGSETADASRLPIVDGRPPKSNKELADRLGPEVGMRHTKIAKPDGMRLVEAIPFVQRPSGPLLADAYLPPGDGPFPVVMLVHGGGWRKGSRTKENHRAHWLAERGIASGAVDYRLGDEHPYPALMHDLQQAVAWLHSDRHDLPIDRDKVVLMGGSAGAHMVALFAAAGDESSVLDPELPADADLSVEGVAIIAGPTDTEHARAARESRRADSNYHVLLRGSIDEQPDRYREFNPSHWLDAAMPPVLLVDENNDDGSRRFRAKLDEFGVPYEAYVFRKTVHPSWHWTPWFEFTMERVEALCRRVWDDEGSR